MQMATKNDVTGAELVTKAATDKYREGYDRIFGKKNSPEPTPTYPGVSEPYRMSDREWAAQDPSLREGCTTHIPGVGDL